MTSTFKVKHSKILTASLSVEKERRIWRKHSCSSKPTIQRPECISDQRKNNNKKKGISMVCLWLRGDLQQCHLFFGGSQGRRVLAGVGRGYRSHHSVSLRLQGRRHSWPRSWIHLFDTGNRKTNHWQGLTRGYNIIKTTTKKTKQIESFLHQKFSLSEQVDGKKAKVLSCKQRVKYAGVS